MDKPDGFDPTNRCLECGIDTVTEGGYVNRVPAERDYIDAYICGSCSVTLDACSDGDGIEKDWSAFEFDDEKWDKHIAEQVVFADERSPNGHAAYMRQLVEELAWKAQEVN
jgi:hypothetical protein